MHQTFALLLLILAPTLSVSADTNAPSTGNGHDLLEQCMASQRISAREQDDPLIIEDFILAQQCEQFLGGIIAMSNIMRTQPDTSPIICPPDDEYLSDAASEVVTLLLQIKKREAGKAQSPLDLRRDAGAVMLLSSIYPCD